MKTMPNKLNPIPTFGRRNHFITSLSKDTFLDLTTPAIVNWRPTNGGDAAVIDLDGYIGRDELREWLEEEKTPDTAKEIKAALREITADKIIVNINSHDGNLNDAVVIFDMLLAKDAEIITNLHGFTTGAGALIAQAGSVRRMTQTAFQLIQRSKVPVCGFINQNSTAVLLEELITIDQAVIDLFARRTGSTQEAIISVMDAGSDGRWMDADRALQMGFIDEIYDAADEHDTNTDHLDSRQQASNRINTAGRKALIKESANPPECKTDSPAPPYQPTALQLKETALHEAGHAIMAMVFGFEIDLISVIPQPCGSAGNITGRYVLNDRDSDVEPWQNIALSMAGPMAGMTFYGGGVHAMYAFNIDQLAVREGVAGDDGFQVQMILESIPEARRSEIKDRAVSFCRSRLLRNWHHVEDLSEKLKKCGEMNAADIAEWFQKRMKHETFYY